MSQQDLFASSLKSLFVDTGALLTGHFQLSSGLHSDQYMQCALLLSHPDRAESIGRALAELLDEPVDIVVSPAMGGVVIGQEVARALKLRHLFAERENGVMTLRRGFSLAPGQRVVVVEDVITTGKSSREVIDLIRSKGAVPAAALAIVRRSAEPPDLGVPVRSLLDHPIRSFRPEECPLCKQGSPVVKPGSRPQP